MRNAVFAAALALAAVPAFAFADAPNCTAPGIVQPVPANNHAMTAEDYPAVSTVEGEEGATFLNLLVGADGKVQDTQLARSSGFARLDDASAVAVKARWLYKPATKDGAPIACWWEAEVQWRLSGYSLDMVSANYANMLVMTAADYPPGALSRDEKGVTVVAVAVSKAGSINNVRVTHSSGFTDLDDAAMAAVRGRLHPAPGSLDGKPAVTIFFVAVGWSPN